MHANDAVDLDLNVGLSGDLVKNYMRYLERTEREIERENERASAR